MKNIVKRFFDEKADLFAPGFRRTTTGKRPGRAAIVRSKRELTKFEQEFEPSDDPLEGAFTTLSTHKKPKIADQDSVEDLELTPAKQAYLDNLDRFTPPSSLGG